MAVRTVLSFKLNKCFSSRAGCSSNVKDFKASWRSGVVFLAVLYALRPDLVDLSRARTRSNRQNLEEAFSIAEKELSIPRLLEPDGNGWMSSVWVVSISFSCTDLPRSCFSLLA